MEIYESISFQSSIYKYLQIRKFPVVRKYLRIRNFPVVRKVGHGNLRIGKWGRWLRPKYIGSIQYTSYTFTRRLPTESAL